MFKKVVKEKQYSSRIEIIHENFFKWKNNTSCMNEEHIIQAAKYFKISVNQLYYTEQELKELKVKNDKTYDPIMAQHHITIKFYDDELKKPFGYILYQLIVSILLLLLMEVTKDAPAERYLMFFSIPVLGLITSINFGRKETFNINYLDDIFYHIDDVKNKHFITNVILNIVQVILVLALIVYILIVPINNVDYTTLTIVIFLAFITILFMCIGLFKNKKKLNKEIYEIFNNYLMIYYLSFHLSLMLTAACVSIVPLDFTNNWYLLFVLILPILSYIQYYLTSKKYSEYKIVYYEHKTDSNRVLFED